ncbi:MAG: IS1595 family transposase, partial [Candidatus Coatesbacteria bacterium]|nr:IS1595 family transposase [Candidatus Coatesbacteria bacterium]
KAYNKLSLNGFPHKRISHQQDFADGRTHINGLENFRGYAKRRLKADHGGFKHSFGLLITERSFSFNHRDADNTLYILRSMLRAC